MNESERKAIEKLHRECTVTLDKYLKEGTEMCRLLSALKSHPATPEERRLLLQQRINRTKHIKLIAPYARRCLRLVLKG
jgi:hypothetical protein